MGEARGVQRRSKSHHGLGVVTGGGHDQDFLLHVVTGDLDEREAPDAPGQTFQKAAARDTLGELASTTSRAVWTGAGPLS